MKTKSSNSTSVKFSSLIACAVCMSACSGSGVIAANDSSDSIGSGSIVLARPLPKIAVGREDSELSPMLGFSTTTQISSVDQEVSDPQSSRQTDPWADPSAEQPSLEINLKDRTIRLVNINNDVTDSSEEKPVQILQGGSSVSTGSYIAPLKQRDPSWYAPDEYFTQRNLSVPPAFSSDRFLKGALGDFVIYLNENTAIHNSKLYSEEVGGLQVSDADMQRLYYAIEAGTRVLVK